MKNGGTPAEHLAETYVGIAVVPQYSAEAHDQQSKGDIGGNSS